MIYEIWSEGYIASGDRGEAVLHGKMEASSFKEACDFFAKNNPEFEKYYDPARMTFWACRLFDNEADARVFAG